MHRDTLKRLKAPSRPDCSTLITSVSSRKLPLAVSNFLAEAVFLSAGPVFAEGFFMRKIIFIAAIGLPLLFLLRVYAIPLTVPESPLWTVRLHAAHGLVAGDAVEEAGQRIGQVVGVTPYSEPSGEVGTD